MAYQELTFAGSGGRLIYLFFANELIYGVLASALPRPNKLDEPGDALRWLGESAVVLRYSQIAQIKEREGDTGLEIDHGSRGQRKQHRLETYTTEQCAELLHQLQQHIDGVMVNSNGRRRWWHAALNPLLAICVAVICGYQVMVPLFWPTLLLVTLVVMLALVTLRLNRTQPTAMRLWRCQKRWSQPLRHSRFVIFSLTLWGGLFWVINQHIEHHYGADAILNAYHEGRLSEYELTTLRLLEVSPDQQDRYGYTVLMYAAEADDVSLAASLIRNGASADIADPQGQTALFHAIGSHSRPLLVLLAGYCDINHRDAYGATPLMYLLEYDPAEDELALLLSHGADANALNLAGDSVLAQALQLGVKPEVIRLLLQYGARLTEQERLSGEYQYLVSKFGDAELAQLLQAVVQ